MRTVDMREVLAATAPAKNNKHLEAVVGRTLGDVSVDELMQAAHSAKAGSEVELAVAPLREVYVEAEEE